jgi:hypothetical protein
MEPILSHISYEANKKQLEQNRSTSTINVPEGTCKVRVKRKYLMC